MMTATTKSGMVLVVVLVAALAKGGAEPLVMQMLQDIVLTSDWDHVTLLYSPRSGMQTDLQYGATLCIYFV